MLILPLRNFLPSNRFFYRNAVVDFLIRKSCFRRKILWGWSVVSTLPKEIHFLLLRPITLLTIPQIQFWIVSAVASFSMRKMIVWKYAWLWTIVGIANNRVCRTLSFVLYYYYRLYFIPNFSHQPIHYLVWITRILSGDAIWAYSQAITNLGGTHLQNALSWEFLRYQLICQVG